MDKLANIYCCIESYTKLGKFVTTSKYNEDYYVEQHVSLSIAHVSVFV